MRIGYSDDNEALRQTLRSYYDALLSPEVRQRLSHSQGIGPDMRAVVRQMGSDGWLGIGWPPEYGGQGRTPIEQFVFFDESMRAQAPVPMLTVNTVGPTIMQFGTTAQKQFFLPKIVAGEIHFCIGYSEPGRRHRSRRAPDASSERRRRVHRQRPEDLDEPGVRRRLLLAGGAHQPRSEEAQGHLDDHRRHEAHRRHHRAPAQPPARAQRVRGVLRRRARAGRQSRR